MFKNNFVGRSLLGALAFLKESVFADEYAAKKGLLQSLDPRIKTAIVLLFILQVLFAKSILVLLFIYAFCLLTACLSGIRLGFFLKRTWVFIPLFSLFITIPAIFSVFSPGESWAALKAGPVNLVITRQGVSGAAFFVMRVITSVSLAVLLSITTRHFELLKVLRSFKVPQIFVMILGICYRYIYLFVEIVENTYLAIKSRCGARVHYRRGQHIVAWNIAYLWLRSYQLNDEVYKAMLSRGYRGEPAVLNELKIRTRDWAVLACVIIVSALIFYFGKTI